MKSNILAAGALALLGACSREPAEGEPAQPRVESTGKQHVPLDEVPQAVVSAALDRAPGMRLAAAEAETRDGRRYFDLGGTLPDGSEIEFDIMEEDGRWRVVETQRDISYSAVPATVRNAALAHDASLRPTRVIESRQEDGLVIYELYAPAGADPQGRKVELKWDGRQASVLTQEWGH